ncbi:MAG: response regulator transcription factor [Actinomycetota bacterium]
MTSPGAPVDGAGEPAEEGSEGAQLVLLVEDDQGLRESLATVLAYQGLTIVQATSAEEATDLLAAHDPDLVVLDVNLPGRSGLELLQSLRAGGDARQVLLLTARQEVADRVAGLDAGADDYLPKPFALDELLARVRVLLRRAGTATAAPAGGAAARGPGAGGGERLVVGDVAVEVAARRVLVAEDEVTLTKLEYDLVELLARHIDQVLTRSVIHERVWGYDEEYGSNTLEVLVSSVRRKLEATGAARIIHTVRGVGYVARPASAASGSSGGRA